MSVSEFTGFNANGVDPNHCLVLRRPVLTYIFMSKSYNEVSKEAQRNEFIACIF